MGLTHSNLRIGVPTQLPMGQNGINPPGYPWVLSEPTGGGGRWGPGTSGWCGVRVPYKLGECSAGVPDDILRVA
jgi:hypothetical protein